LYVAKRLLAVALGLGLLVAVELGLRAGSWLEAPCPRLPTGWAEGTRLVTAENRGAYLETTRDQAGQPRMRTARRLVRDRFMHDLDWAQVPDPDRPRVFCFGGSATLGVPLENQPERTFPGRLQARLAQRGRPAEVINLGGASFGSDQVLELMGSVASHGPDALVVYSANNEFFNYALGLHQLNQGWAQASLHRLRLFRLLQRALSEDGQPDATLAQQGPDAALDRQRAVVAAALRHGLAGEGGPVPVPEGLWQRRDIHYQAVVARYRGNLRQMAAIAERAGATLYLVPVPANLVEPPWLALPDPQLSALGAWRWQRQMALGAERAAQGRLKAASAAYGAATDIDPIHAQAWYQRGLAQLELGQHEAARHDLRVALELDMDPGRPPRALAEAVLATAREHPAVVVADPRQSFAAAAISPGGGGLFHDSCHLSAQGYDVLAEVVAAAMPAVNPAQPSP